MKGKQLQDKTVGIFTNAIKSPRKGSNSGIKQ